MSSRYDNLLANVPTDLWIGGKWRKSSDGGRFDVLDPATENKIASVASATVEDAKAAVNAASAAFAGWAARKPRERAEILRKSYELIMRDAERLAKLITIENGKALSDSRSEEHTSELQSHSDLVCRLLLEKKKIRQNLGATLNNRHNIS